MPVNTYDLYMRPLTQEELVGEQLFTLGADRSMAVRGLTKLLCQWTRLFMTPKTSDPMDIEAGTDFPNLIGSNISSLGDIQDVVITAILDCNEQMFRRQQLTMFPAEEMLSSATLTGFEPWGEDGFQAWVLISNVAGEEATVALPAISTSTTSL